MKKQFAFTALSAGLALSVIAGNLPVYAKTNSEIKISYDTVQLKKEEALIDCINKSFKEDFSDLKIKSKNEDTTIFESDTFTVTVDGIDVGTLGAQNGTISVDKKEKRDPQFVQVVHDKLVQKSEEEMKTKEVVVHIQDDTAPTIQVKDTISVDQNTEFDLSKEIVAEDNFDEKVQVKYTDTVDTSTIGTYTIEVLAQDQSGNKTKKDVTIQVEKNFYDRIAEAALAQVGVYQDCTMLVTNSLRAVGIDFHSAPAGYLSLGQVTNNPVPGDIIVYAGHVAIYIGDGKAVHGGWNGNQTVVTTVNCSQPIIAYVHVTR